MNDSLRKQSASGITVGGKTLEEVVAEEEAKELEEVLKPEYRHIMQQGKPKYAEAKGSNGAGKVLTRREINKEKWRSNVMEAKTIDEAIAAVLLSGREVTGTEIFKDIINDGNTKVTRSKVQQRFSYLLNKTGFGKLVKGRREGKGKAFRLVSGALDLRPEELAHFAIKSRVDKVLEHHPMLKSYFEEEELKIETMKRRVESDLSEIENMVSSNMKPISKGVGDVVKEAISQALGVNVSISGKIEIVFKLG